MLLPTALLLLMAPGVMRAIDRAPYAVLVGLMACQLGLSLLKTPLQGTELGTRWGVRLLLLEGLGGFPVLPFLVNGCLGVWIGMAHRLQRIRLLPLLALLAALQLWVYASSFWSDAEPWRVLRDCAGPLGKFGCIYLLAIAASHWLPTGLASAIESVGRYALASFVMHRVFLQSLAISLGVLGVAEDSPALRYAALFVGTLVLTWLLCQHRQATPRVDVWFRRVAM